MHIVVIDDEKILSSGVERKLTQEHYGVTVMNSYDEYLSQKENNADMYIIDISLGDGSGLDIVKSLRNEAETKDIPILIMSGHDNVGSKVEGLDIGADDYLVKPFDPEELLARVRSLLRRRKSSVGKSICEYKDYSYDFNKRQISYKGTPITITKRERQILELFLSHTNVLIKKEDIAEKLWRGNTANMTDNNLNVTICNLRKKLGEDFKLETRIGDGYILNE